MCVVQLSSIYILVKKESLDLLMIKTTLIFQNLILLAILHCHQRNADLKIPLTYQTHVHYSEQKMEVEYMLLEQLIFPTNHR